MLVRYASLVLIASWLFSVRTEIASGSGNTVAGGSGSGNGSGGGGWLDRLVQFYKNRWVDDVEKAQSVKIDVALEEAPAGYEDSSAWDAASVLRLVALVRRAGAERARPVRRALRRVLRPLYTRRLYYTPEDSRIMFPSLKKLDPNNFYYSDSESEADKGKANQPTYDYVDSYEAMESQDPEIKQIKKAREKFEASRKNVIVVRNPVEARLPSSRISLELLKKIMEERALMARITPSSTKITITWLPRFNVTQSTTKKPKSKDEREEDGGGDTASEVADGQPEPDPAAEPEPGAEPGGKPTAEAEGGPGAGPEGGAEGGAEGEAEGGAEGGAEEGAAAEGGAEEGGAEEEE